jgi:hypothetical protein
MTRSRAPFHCNGVHPDDVHGDDVHGGVHRV